VSENKVAHGVYMIKKDHVFREKNQA